MWLGTHEYTTYFRYIFYITTYTWWGSSRATGAHIVMGCGHYVHDYQDPANATRCGGLRRGDGRVGGGRRLGGEGARGHQWRDRLLSAVDRAGAACHEGCVLAQRQTGAGP